MHSERCRGEKVIQVTLYLLLSLFSVHVPSFQEEWLPGRTPAPPASEQGGSVQAASLPILPVGLHLLLHGWVLNSCNWTQLYLFTFVLPLSILDKAGQLLSQLYAVPRMVWCYAFLISLGTHGILACSLLQICETSVKWSLKHLGISKTGAMQPFVNVSLHQIQTQEKIGHAGRRRYHGHSYTAVSRF